MKQYKIGDVFFKLNTEASENLYEFTILKIIGKDSEIYSVMYTTYMIAGNYIYNCKNKYKYHVYFPSELHYYLLTNKFIKYSNNLFNSILKNIEF